MRLAVVAYIVRVDGLMLSVPRDNGQHAAPGGKVEPGETLELALSREVEEETGLRVLAAWRVHVGTNNGFLVYCFRCEVEGEPEAREPGTRIEWVTPEQLAAGMGSRLYTEGLRSAGLLGAVGAGQAVAYALRCGDSGGA